MRAAEIHKEIYIPQQWEWGEWSEKKKFINLSYKSTVVSLHTPKYNNAICWMRFSPNRILFFLFFFPSSAALLAEYFIACWWFWDALVVCSLSRLRDNAVRRENERWREERKTKFARISRSHTKTTVCFLEATKKKMCLQSLVVRKIATVAPAAPATDFAIDGEKNAHAKHQRTSSWSEKIRWRDGNRVVAEQPLTPTFVFARRQQQRGRRRFYQHEIIMMILFRAGQPRKYGMAADRQWTEGNWISGQMECLVLWWNRRMILCLRCWYHFHNCWNIIKLDVKNQGNWVLYRFINNSHTSDSAGTATRGNKVVLRSALGLFWYCLTRNVFFHNYGAPVYNNFIWCWHWS